MDIECQCEDGVQTLRLNRAQKKNALTGEMYSALADALERGDQSQDVAVHVFLGSEGIFSAGNDLNDFVGFAQSGSLGAPVLRFLKALATTQKPMVAAVDGLAVGIGTTLLFHCDLVYASERARFRTPFLDLGLVPEAASSLLIPRHIGYHRAFEMLCLGTDFDAEAAHAAGFVNAVTTPDGLEEAALAAAQRLAQKPRAALSAARRLMRGDQAAILAKIDEEAAEFAERLKSAEAEEALVAFSEKRPPDFSKIRG